MSELKIKFTGDASNYEANIRRVRGVTDKAIRDMKADSERAALRQGVSSQFVQNMQANVVRGPAMLAARSNMRVASTMFISALRDTFASLASGQNPVTVLAQQAPQVAQGLFMMGRAGIFAAAKFLGLGGAAVAVAGTLYTVYKRSVDTAIAWAKVHNALLPVVAGIKALDDAWNRATVTMEEYHDRLEKASGKKTATQEIDDEIHAINRRHDVYKRDYELRKQLAEAKNDDAGVDKANKSLREIEESRERQILKTRREGLEKIRGAQPDAEQKAEGAIREARSADAKVGQIEDEIAQRKERAAYALKNEQDLELNKDIRDAHKRGRLLEEAEIRKAEKELLHAKKVQRERERVSRDAQQEAVSLREQEAAQKEAIAKDEAEAEANAKQREYELKYGPQIRGAQGSGGRAKISVSELQRIGAYISTQGNAESQTAKEILKENRTTNKILKSIAVGRTGGVKY